MWELSVFCVGVSLVLMYTWGIFQGTQQPLFLRHEGYLGAIGAFLKGADEDGTLKSLSCASSCASNTLQNNDIEAHGEIVTCPESTFHIFHFSFIVIFDLRIRSVNYPVHDHLMCDRHFLVFLADTIVVHCYLYFPPPQPSP